ncbi:MAG: ABC transporter permease [Acidimicrobiales bacterium]
MIRRLVHLVAVLALVSVGTFALLSAMPGDPAVAIAGPTATVEDLDQLRNGLGLDRPAPLRFLQWVSAALRGDLGVSYVTNQPVGQSLRERLPASLQLVIGAQVVAVLGALVAATVAAARVGGPFDRILRAASFAGVAVPSFAVGVVLSGLFIQRLGWFDTFGYVPWGRDPRANVEGLILPVLSLAVPLAALYVRVLRNDLVATLGQPHILAARLNGLGPVRVVLAHALRQSLSTLLTVVALNVPALLGSAVLVESLFAIPGIGRLLVRSVSERDYLVAQGAVLIIAVTYVITVMAVEALRHWADPRLRADQGSVRQ